MTGKKPKDYQLAEVGYNAFYGEQPQVFFDNLSHDYQMRWVHAGRAMMQLHDSFKRGPNARTLKQKLTDNPEHMRAMWRKQKARKRMTLAQARENSG